MMTIYCGRRPGLPAVVALAASVLLSILRVSSAEESEADTYSNIRRADYVGPEECGQCHAENYASWQQHPHSRMNMLATAKTVLGDFSGVSVVYAGRRAHFRRQEGQFIVDYFRDRQLIRRFRVTRVIGWRYEQDYVAVQIQGPEPPDHPLYTEEIRLRFSYSLQRQRWLPQSYLEPTEYPASEYLDDGSLRYDPFEPDLVSFNKRCARCHNTYPYDLRLYKIYTKNGMVSGFAPGPGLTPETVNRLARDVGDERYLTDEELLTERFVTVGISCESCHFGGREHALDSSTEIRFVPTHPMLSGWTPDHSGARKNPEVVNAICRQCHHSGAVAQDNWPDGSASVNSMESVEMDRGACWSQIKCTDCHDTHIRGPDAGAAGGDEHIEACLQCHEQLLSPKAKIAHTRHDPGQTTCLDCHMPRIVQGFHVYNRSHRISSPTEETILATGMPNACNLCHLDKSLAWTRDALARDWGTTVHLPQSLTAQFGRGFKRPAGDAWLSHPSSMVRTVAAGAYARSPQGKQALPRLLSALDEPNAYARMRFLQDAERILGRKLDDEEYSPIAPRDRRAEQVRLLNAGR